MRHLGSIILSIVFAPIIYVLSGVGMIRLSINAGLVSQDQGTNWTDVGVGAGAVVLAGVLYAVLTMTRISPLGPLIAALAYIGAQVWALFDQSSVFDTLGNSVFGTSGAAEAPLTGLALLLAVPLLATIFSPRRWRGADKAKTVVERPATLTYAAPDAPNFPQPTSAAPMYTPVGGPAERADLGYRADPADRTEPLAGPVEGAVPVAEPATEPVVLSAPPQTTPATASDARSDEPTSAATRSDEDRSDKDRSDEATVVEHRPTASSSIAGTGNNRGHRHLPVTAIAADS